MATLVENRAELIPGYRLVKRLGAGGFGEVWKAEAPGGMFKAVKIIHGSLSEGVLDETRLNQELKSLNRIKGIRHPYILSLERFDIVDGRLVIVSELADGTLFDRFKECRAAGLPGIPRDELLGYMQEAAEALDLMNEQFHLQHLDIKPQNIFLQFNHVKVGDFGLVKDLEGMFATITCGMTAVYSAPETFEGVVSRFCDEYNLAITYQEMLTGQLPYDGTTYRQLMLQHVMGVPNLTALPAGDQPVAARALAKKPEERFPSCREFVRALRNGAGAAVSTAETLSERMRPIATPASVDEQQTALTRHGSRPNLHHDAKRDTGPTREPAAIAAPEAVQPHALVTPAKVVEHVAPPPPPERAETAGAGVLLPALIIGLGGLGRGALEEFRKALRKRGPNESWPQLRLLSLDTDPEAHERALREPDSVLTPEEQLVTSFHRPSHYLKRQHERNDLERWLPLNQFTSIVRGQTTAEGWRALGRLAFLSSQATLPARLRQELEACSNEQSLQDVARRTSLGLRTTRPCVYVVTSLAGGTGAGMFLDLAQAVRHELRHMGHPRAELIAILLAPAVKGNVETRDVANSFAALAELKHFSKANRPFDRCVVLPLPPKSEGASATQELLSLAGDFLSRELTTPLGRVADEGRKAHLGTGMHCQTFGAYWFSVPRQPVLRRVVQHICTRVVRGWKVNDPGALTAAIEEWAGAALKQANLGLEAITSRLEDACANALGQPPRAWCESLRQTWTKGAPGDVRQGAPAVRKVMKDLEELLGPPEKDPQLDLTSPLVSALQDGYRSIVEQAGTEVAELSLCALGEPEFRLACKEEVAQKQLGVALEASACGLKRRGEELRALAWRLWQEISPRLSELQAGGFFRSGARTRAAEAIRVLLSQYLDARWQCVLAMAACQFAKDLQVHLHRYRRAVDCCHKRIGQFVKAFTDLTVEAAPVDLGLGRYLLPFGCQTLDEAVERIIASLPAEEETALHKDVWNLIHASFEQHVHVCTASASLFRELHEQIERAVEKVAENSLGRAHAAEVYIERQAENPDADHDLPRAFDQAQSELSHGGAEFSILAVPPGPEGERFRALVQHALPDVPVRPAASTDDIVFYREESFTSLDILPQLSPTAREQYKHFLTTSPFGPHSRADIAW